MERKDDGSGGGLRLSRDENSTGNGHKEDSIIVVICESESQRDETLKVINGQILELREIANRMVNPFL